jgi:GNAT superfamily N-acetyltransferase
MGYEIERYNSSNQEVFFAFAREIWPDDPRKWDPDYLAWLYCGGREMESNLFLFRHDGRVVGSLGTFPVEWKCADKIHPALWVADFFLLPDYRNKGLGVLLLKEAESCAEVLLTTGMSESAETLYRKLKWNECHRGELFLLLRDARSMLARGFGSRLVKSMFRLGAGLFFRFRSLLGGRCPELPAGVRMTPLDRWDPRLWTLWQKWAERLSVACLRTPEWVGWRYFGGPSPVNSALIAEKGEACVGAVFVSLDQDSNGFRRGRILDCFWDPDLHGLARPILKEALSRLLKQDPAYVTAISALPEIRHALNRLGFLAVQNRPIMWKGPEIPPDARWHFSLGDSDSGLGQ